MVRSYFQQHSSYLLNHIWFLSRKSYEDFLLLLRWRQIKREL